jgi:hypothetical protein
MAWRNRSTPCALTALTLILAATPAFAQKQYGERYMLFSDVLASE